MPTARNVQDQTCKNILQPVVVKYAQSGKLGKLGEGACK